MHPDGRTALELKYGEGRWVIGLSASGVLLDRALIEKKGLAHAALAADGKAALLSLPEPLHVFVRRVHVWRDSQRLAAYGREAVDLG